jgi:hypothetical protein
LGACQHPNKRDDIYFPRLFQELSEDYNPASTINQSPKWKGVMIGKRAKEVILWRRSGKQQVLSSIHVTCMIQSMGSSSLSSHLLPKHFVSHSTLLAN